MLLGGYVQLRGQSKVPVGWPIKAPLHSLISFITHTASIVMFICLMPAIPCCFPSQEGKRVSFTGSLNPQLFYQSINKRATQVSHHPRHGVAQTQCLPWALPSWRRQRVARAVGQWGQLRATPAGLGQWGQRQPASLSWAPVCWSAGRLQGRIQKVGGEAHDSDKQVQRRWKWTAKSPFLSLWWKGKSGWYYQQSTLSGAGAGEAAGLCSRRSSGPCVQLPRANASPMGTEPWGSYQALWRHSGFFTRR